MMRCFLVQIPTTREVVKKSGWDYLGKKNNLPKKPNKYS
jgi:hypothetical protein